MPPNAATSFERRLLDAIVSAHSQIALDQDPKTLSQGLLTALLDLTESESGFICETSIEGGSADPESYAAADGASSAATGLFYAKRTPSGQESRELDALLGAVSWPAAKRYSAMPRWPLPNKKVSRTATSPSAPSWACRFAAAAP